jgi:hypothetical protein
MDVNRGGINVHIGEIVLEAEGSVDRAELAEAVQRELARLQRDEPTGSIRDRSSNAIVVHQAGSASPAAIDPGSAGKSIAQIVHTNLRSL